MPGLVHCRLCGKDINRQKQTDWCNPATNYYYHTACYEMWKEQKVDRNILLEKEDNEWFTLLKDYVQRDIRMTDAKFDKITSQWKHFLNNKNRPMTAKGIYFAVLYFYDVMHGSSEKADGGIGIVPYIYAQSCKYWMEREEQQTGFIAAVVQQMTERRFHPELKLDPNTRQRRKPKWNMEAL